MKQCDISEKDFRDFLDILSSGLTYKILVEKYPFDYDEEMLRIEKDILHFFRDNEASLIHYIEEDELIAVAAVREIGDKTIFVYEPQILINHRKIEVTDVLMKHIKEIYPDHSVYKIYYDEALRDKDDDVKLHHILYEKEHPNHTHLDGWGGRII